MEKNEIRAVELVRRIRDEQAALLAGKSDTEVLEFFRQAGQAAREEAQKRAVQRAPATRDIERTA
jgi:hypothetical protein